MLTVNRGAKRRSDVFYDAQTTEDDASSV
jgi:hypothetical protein